MSSHQPPPVATLLAACFTAFAAVAPAVLVAQDAASPRAGGAPIRVGLRARSGGADRLTSLRYIGGFETKTLLLETLVRRDHDGRIVGALASSWEIGDGGKAFRFELREDAKFHDGTPVTATDVCAHFRRWFGHTEHDWLRVNRRITGVEELSAREFVVRLEQPYALLDDLVAINPCAIVGPTSNDWEGEFMRPIGTGPFRFAAAFDEGRRWRLAAVDPTGPTIDVTFYPRGRDTTPIDDLLRGSIDAFVGGWDEDLPAERLTEIEQDPRYALDSAPGSSVLYLSFRMTEGPTAEQAVRERIADAINRAEIVRIVEGGRADPCTTWAAPSVAFWPGGPATARYRAGRVAVPAATPLVVDETAPPLEIVVSGGRSGRTARAAMEVVAQLQRAGIAARYAAPPAHLRESSRAVVDATGAVRPLTTESGEVRAATGRAARERGARADIRVEVTHGMPYCPHQSLVARFGAGRSPERERADVPTALRELVEQAAATPAEGDRLPLYAQIQTLMDREVIIVPLYSPWRVAIRTAGVDGIVLDPDVYHVDLRGLRRVGGK